MFGFHKYFCLIFNFPFQIFCFNFSEGYGPHVIEHGYDNDLKYAMRASGGSFGIVTEFLYKIYPKPETLSCLLLVIFFYILQQTSVEIAHLWIKSFLYFNNDIKVSLQGNACLQP